MDVPDVDASGKSNVPGVYVVGDARTGFSGLIAAANEGAGCVEGIVHDLALERWQRLT
jgi:pyruvate/2-oxoglutarate dehydrogenase complex dihydrolipoamide dehydrogenase (E3) component